MAFTYTKEWAVSSPSGRTTSTKTYSCSASLEIDESVANGATDFAIAAAIDVSAVKAFYLLSDQAVTIETNSGSAADDTLTLVANRPYEWDTDSEDAFLLGTDVTSLFVTNASGSTANITLRCGSDATP
jgi:hypothetical protein